MPKDTRDVADIRADPAASLTGKTAALYRMALPNHLCPAGQKARWLLNSHVFEVDDPLFRERSDVNAFNAKHEVSITPQIWTKGETLGGYDTLLEELTDCDPNARTFQSVFSLFAVAAATALALSIGVLGAVTWQTLGWFISVSMILLGMQKLRDMARFTTMFLNDDLLARKWAPYACVYPWVETVAGILLAGMLLSWLAAPAALFIGTVGALSVGKAVSVDRRALKSACVGGGSNVPVGFVSLGQNLMMMMMMGIAIVMLVRIGGLWP